MYVNEYKSINKENMLNFFFDYLLFIDFLFGFADVNSDKLKDCQGQKLFSCLKYFRKKQNKAISD